MRVRLKGINSITKRLADGSMATYYYAWKGGPRLDGKPGSPEFVAAYNAACAQKIKSPEGQLRRIISRFTESSDFNTLSAKTQSDYQRYLKIIEDEFGDFPLSALESKKTRGMARSVFLEWRDKIAKRSLRSADYAFTVLARIFSWAASRGIISEDENPCTKAKRLFDRSRADIVWTDDDERRLLAVASPQICLALTIAIETGQRQGDLLRAVWSAYDGTHMRFLQRKGKVRVKVPVTSRLRQALDEAAKTRKSTHILTNEDGHPWTESGFRSSWAKACKKAGIAGLTFHDLRGTAVTRLAKAGCSEAEIISITGHSLNDAKSILEAHYLNLDPELAESAVAKLEEKRKGTKFPN